MIRRRGKLQGEDWRSGPVIDDSLNLIIFQRAMIAGLMSFLPVRDEGNCRNVAS